MLTIEQAREILRLDTADNDAIIEGLLPAIPDYIELTTGVTADQQAQQPLADTAGKFILMLWYNAERADAEKLQRTIDSLLKTLALIAVRKG
ncbi:MAG: head-tail connector protein [Eubacterium sp.]|nr:head-tail connector protein [Eubacterium sp.]